MMKKLAYKTPEGTISIVIPAPKKDLEKVLGALTDQQYEDHVRERSIPAGVTAVDIGTVPSDRYFRNAWDLDNTTITVPMAKAREVQKENLRELRVDKLKTFDVDFMRAIEGFLETGDKAPAQAIAAKKKILRDATDKADNAAITTLDALKTAGIADIESV